MRHGKFGQKSRVAAKNRGFWLKVAGFGRKSRIFVESRGFWLKVADFGRKSRIVVESRGLWSNRDVVEMSGFVAEFCLIFTVAEPLFGRFFV